MEEIVKIIIGVAVLLLGFPIGNFLARITKEEIKEYQKWFKLIIIFSAAGSLISVIFRNDILLFSFLFIIIVTSRSLIRKNKN